MEGTMPAVNQRKKAEGRQQLPEHHRNNFDISSNVLKAGLATKYSKGFRRWNIFPMADLSLSFFHLNLGYPPKRW
jgi:hypothetical protein